MSQRRRALGWESGTIADGAITGGNITVDATEKRTGNYGLLIDGQSGVNSHITYAWGNPSTWDQEFHRFYLKSKSTLPSADITVAIFQCATTGIIAASTLELILKSTGFMEFRRNGTLVGTSASALAADTFYCIEVGMEKALPSASLRINTNVEIDWTTMAGLGQQANIAFGKCDTVAATQKIVIDDWEVDVAGWCGVGRVKRIGVTGIKADSANWANVGAAATKWQAVNEVTPDDDTSYIVSSASGAVIYFTVAAAPADAVTIRGISWYVRGKRDGGSNSTNAVRPRTGDFIGGAIVATNIFTSTYTTAHFDKLTAYSPKGARIGIDMLADYAVGIHASTASAGRISAVWAEVGYVDVGDAVDDHFPIYICGFEDGVTEFVDRANSSVAGTVAADTAHPKFGSNALKITSAAGGRSYADFGMSASTFAETDTELWICGWCYFETLPSSGSMDICGIGSTSTSRNNAVFVNSDGSVNTIINGVNGTATPAGTIVTGKYYYFACRFQGRSATSATDGALEVWIDDLRAINRTAIDTLFTGLTAQVSFIGAHANVAGGGIEHWDGLILDLQSRHGRHAKVATLHPTAAGANTDAAFTASAGSKWDCIDDTPNDGDTSYVLSPLSTTALETYVTEDLPAAAKTVYGLQITAVHKRDGASNGTMKYGYKPTNQPEVITANVGDSATYAGSSTPYQNTVGRGVWTPSLVSVIELELKAANATNKTRVTTIYATVAYTEISSRGANRNAQAKIIG